MWEGINIVSVLFILNRALDPFNCFFGWISHKKHFPPPVNFVNSELNI